MTNKELIRFIRQHKMKLLVPMQVKNDVVYVAAEKSGIIELYSERSDEYETGMEIHVNDGFMYMDIDFAV